MNRPKPQSVFAVAFAPLVLGAILARPARAATEEVRCGTGADSITRALGRHAGEPLRIEVSGTCIESVLIDRDDVSIVGVTPNAGIEAPGDLADDAIVRIVRARGTFLSSLTISGGGFPARGVQIDHAGDSVHLSNLVLTDVFLGVEVQYSAVTLQSVAIEASEGTALFLARHAEMTCADCDLSAGEEIATVLQESTLTLVGSTVSLTGVPPLATIQVADGSSAVLIETDLPGRFLARGRSQVRLTDSSADDLDLFDFSTGTLGSGLTVGEVALTELSRLLVDGTVGTLSCATGSEALCLVGATVGTSTCSGCPATP